jgi:hypothetical protein
MGFCARVIIRHSHGFDLLGSAVKENIFLVTIRQLMGLVSQIPSTGSVSRSRRVDHKW